MTRSFFIMTLLYHLFKGDFSANVRTISLFCYPQKDYYFTYDTSIISLILSASIIAIIAFITLLFALFLSQTFFTVIFFEDYYLTYLV